MRGLLAAIAFAVVAPAAACGAGAKDARSTRRAGAVEVESWALICPEGTSLRGHPPPEGSALWCERADGTRHGPFVRWRSDGGMDAFGEYAGGRPTWTVACSSRAAQCERIKRALF